MNLSSRFGVTVALCGVLLALPAAASSTRGPSNEQRAAQANAQLAIEYLRKGDLATAKEKAERALSQDSRSTASQTAAALVYDRLGEPRKARDHYEQALRYSDGSPDAQNNLAAFLCRTGDRKLGEQHFREAAANPLYRTPEAALTNAARCARADGRPADAEPYLRQALTVRPDFPEALYELADLYLQLGNPLQSRAFLQRYLAAARPSASAAWLGYRVERALGDTEQAEAYARSLKTEFATSEQTRELLELEKARP